MITNEDKAIEILRGKKFSIIGNFSYNDAFDAIIEMAEYKDAQHRTPSDDTTEGFVHIVIGEVACHETDLQRQIEQGKDFAESNKTVFEVAMAVAKFYKEQLDLRMDAYARERKALDEIAKLKKHIKKVGAESSADIQKLDAENKILRDSNDKLRFTLRERETEIERLKDEHKKEMDEYRAVYFRQNKILVEQNNALKRQLDESNRQIEIYAKKVRNLEAELEEDGGLG